MKAEIEKNRKMDEMDEIQGGLDQEFDRRHTSINEIPEKYLVAKNLLSKYIPIIVKIVTDLSFSLKPHCSLLERSAVLALSKLMCISEQFCIHHIELLISLLDKPHIDPVIKNNVLITIGDLLHRYPNKIEPKPSVLYRCLRDENTGVKRPL